MVSTVDPDARHIHKNRTRHQDGFKGRASFEPETGLFIAVTLTGGYGPDSHEATVAAVLLGEEEGTLTVLGDSAHGTGELREQLQAAGHTLVIKPPSVRRTIPGGFTIDDFHIDPVAGTATCPAGHPANLGQVRTDGARTAQFKCLRTGCPSRNAAPPPGPDAPSTSTPSTNCRPLSAVRPPPPRAWQDEYRRWRPPVEHAIAWLVVKGSRRVPHRGVTANNIWLHPRAGALNLRRLINLGLTLTRNTWRLTPATT